MSSPHESRSPGIRRGNNRGFRKRRSPGGGSEQSWTLKDYRGGNQHLIRTALEGVLGAAASLSEQSTVGFDPGRPLTPPNLDQERQKFSFPARPDDKSESPPIDLATCGKEVFDKWLIALVSTIPPSTASSSAVRNGNAVSSASQRDFFVRESILLTVFGTLQDAVDVLRRYQYDVVHQKKLLQAYYCAVEEDAQDCKPEANKYTVFHSRMRERNRESPVLKYQLTLEDVTARKEKLLYVLSRLESVDGISADRKDAGERNGDHFEVGYDRTNSDDEDLETFEDGSLERERILLKMKKAKILKVLAKKGGALERCLHLPVESREVTSRLRNELVLPFSARVLSLKDASSKGRRDDQVNNFVEWYVHKVVDPFAMSQLLRVVPMEYIVTTTCRLVSACDVNLSLRAQALPDFTRVIVRAVREGREEAFSQLAVSPSVSFLAALQTPALAALIFYAAVLNGQSDVIRRVLSEGFFEPQVLLVLLFFSGDWGADDCSGYLKYQLTLSQEMVDLHQQLKRASVENPMTSRSCSQDHSPMMSTSHLHDLAAELGHSADSSNEDKKYRAIEASLRLYFSADSPSGLIDQKDIASHFIYGPLQQLRILLEMRNRTKDQLHRLLVKATGSAGANRDGTVNFQDLGLESVLGSVLRKEFEAARWNHILGKKTPGTPDSIENAATAAAGGEPASTEPKAASFSQNSFSALLRGRWLDALVGHPLENVMLPSYSTKWLHRLDKGSYLPLSSSSKPLLIRSDCFVNTQEQNRSMRLYSSSEAKEARDVIDAEEERAMKVHKKGGIPPVPPSAPPAKGGRSSSRDSSPPRVRRRQVRAAELYDGSYYFETHVSLDYLLFASENQEDSSGGGMAKTRGPNALYPAGLLNSFLPPSPSSVDNPNALVIGYCTESWEKTMPGITCDTANELGYQSGSGGLSFTVVGHQIVGDVTEEDGSMEQEEEMVLQMHRHSDGAVTAVSLPRRDKMQDSLLPSEFKASGCRHDELESIRSEEEMGLPRAVSVSSRATCQVADHASFLLVRLRRRRQNLSGRLSDSRSSASLSEEGMFEDGTSSPLGIIAMDAPDVGSDDGEDGQKKVGVSFPVVHFLTDAEYHQWEEQRTEKHNSSGSKQSSPFSPMDGNTARTQFSKAVRSTLMGGGTTTLEGSIFGESAIAIGFFLNLKRNSISVTLNGAPIGVVFNGVGVWPIARVYPAATIRSSLSLVERLQVSDEFPAAHRAAAPVIRFVFQRNEVVGDRLAEHRHLWVSEMNEFTLRGTPSVNASTAASPLLSPAHEGGGGDEVSFTNSPRTTSPARSTTKVSFPQSQEKGEALPAQMMSGVIFMDTNHKFKQLLEVLCTTSIETADHAASAENPTATDKGGVGTERSASEQASTSKAETNQASASDNITYQRSNALLNCLLTSGFQNALFFPSVQIRRRSDDTSSDLLHNGISIINETGTLSPLCAALACRRKHMALSIASHFRTNMYHTNPTAVKQRRLALLSACALGYDEVVQVLLERMPVYEVLALFSILIQRDELEVLRREHRRKNIVVSKMHLVNEAQGSTANARRQYAVASTKLDPLKMYSSKTCQYTPLHCAFLGRTEHTRTVTVLLNYLYTTLNFRGGPASLSQTYLRDFREAEEAGKVFSVVDSYPFLRDAVNVPSRAGETALLIATRQNNPEVVKRLLNFGASPVCQDRISHSFALEIACASRYLSVAQALFATEAYNSPLMVNHAGVATPLCWCAINNIPEMIPPLLASGADPMKGLDDNSPLLLAVTFKSEEAALCLLEHCRSGKEPEGSESEIKPVINVNDVDARTQCTALHIACELGLVSVVRALLHFHASLTIFTKLTYVTPLHTAILNGKKAVALALLEYAKDQLRRGVSVLDINAIDKGGNTPLHLAARAGMAEVVECIVAQFSQEEVSVTQKASSPKSLTYVDFSRTNNQGKTPLLVAIQFHEVQCAELIVAYSYDTSFPGGIVVDGTCTAVTQAISSNLQELVVLLLSYPQFQATARVREDFMRTYTSQRTTFDKMEAKFQVEARKNKREAARKARASETEYHNFPVDNDDEEEEEESEAEESEDDVRFEEEMRRKSLFAARLPVATRKPSRGQLTNYTGALMMRTRALCPTQPQITMVESRPQRKSISKFGVDASPKRRSPRRDKERNGSRRFSYIRELLSRTHSSISPEVALKLLLRGFALPELFVMLEEVAVESIVVGIQNPSAMVHSESLLGFLKEHFDVSIVPSKSVGFCRDLLEHIVSLLQRMGGRSAALPHWYHHRDRIADTLRRYPPFCRHTVRILRLHGKSANCTHAMEELRVSVSKHDFHAERDGVKTAKRSVSTESGASYTIEELERAFTTPFQYTLLQLATSLGLAPLVSFMLNELKLSPFFVPVQRSHSHQQTDPMEISLLSTQNDMSLFGFDCVRSDDGVSSFNDLYNHTENKWCCSPYRLSVRSFHASTVGAYLRLFQDTGREGAGLSEADCRHVVQRYERVFGVGPGKVPISSMAADYREPLWVDPKGNTALQEVFSELLNSRLSVEMAADDDDGSRSEQGTPQHLHSLSSLEMYRGNLKGSAQTIARRLLKGGASASGCFNTDGLDAWLIAFSTKGEAGRISTSVLLRFGCPLLGSFPAFSMNSAASTGSLTHRNSFSSEAGEHSPHSNPNISGTDNQSSVHSYLNSKDRMMEELATRGSDVVRRWEEAGLGIPNSAPAESYERLVFKGTPLKESLGRKSELTSEVHPEVVHVEVPEDSNRPLGSSTAVVGEEGSAVYSNTSTLDHSLETALYATQSRERFAGDEEAKLDGEAKDVNHIDDVSVVTQSILSAYATYLLFACAEQNHQRLVDLLMLFPFVLPSTARHPFTRSSLLDRIIRRAVQQLMMLKEVPMLKADEPNCSQSGSQPNSPRWDSTVQMPLSTSVGKAMLHVSSSDLCGTGTGSPDEPSVEEKFSEPLTHAHRDPYRIPIVRELLDVAKNLLDTFQFSHRFEPAADGETALSLAAIIGYAPLMSRMICGSRRERLSQSMSRKLTLSRTVQEKAPSTPTPSVSALPKSDTSDVAVVVLEPEAPAEQAAQTDATGLSDVKSDVTFRESPETIGPPTLTGTMNPTENYTLSSAMDEPMVCTLLATRFYWGEEDARTLYAILDNIEGVENQVAFLSVAYPNIHPLPALWLAAQYVDYCNVLLHPQACNIAFWANLLYAQYIAKLEELPIRKSVWSELLTNLLPRAPAIPIYLILCHWKDDELVYRSGGRRTQGDTPSQACLHASEVFKEVSHTKRGSCMLSGTESMANLKYPILKVQADHAPPPPRSVSQHTEGSPELKDSSLSSLMLLVDMHKGQSNWNIVVQRVRAYLHVSALLAAESLYTASGPTHYRRGAKRKAVAIEEAVTGLTGTTLLDVIEVAARYDRADEVISLVKISSLLYAPLVTYDDSNASPLSEADVVRVVSNTVIICQCLSLIANANGRSALTVLVSMERLLWRELIESKHLDMIAVAAGSRQLLARLYNDPVVSSFLTTMRYDRIDIYTGVPEGMTIIGDEPDDGAVAAAPHPLSTAPTTRGSSVFNRTADIMYFKGWIAEYITSLLKTFASQRSEGGGSLSRGRGIMQACSRLVDEDEWNFCHRSYSRAAVGTLLDRHDIAKTTWGIGAAAQILHNGAKKSLGRGPPPSAIKEEEPIVPVPAALGKLSTSDVTRGRKKSTKSDKKAAAAPASPRREPKPLYQMFLQTDWATHSSQALISPRPSIQTIDVLFFLLEKRSPLSLSALQLFFSGSLDRNDWRGSSDQRMTIAYQTLTQKDSLLHILVMNDQYQLVEVYLMFAMYYLYQWSMDSPNLAPGIFPVREKYALWSASDDDDPIGNGDNALPDRMYATSFTRSMMRLNRYGLTPFDYAHSSSMVILLQRFGCVPPSYRPNPNTFTRAMNLKAMAETDINTPAYRRYFTVPQIVLSSENFLRLMDGENSEIINRLAGIKVNESTKLKFEKALLASFQAASSGKKGELVDDDPEGPSVRRTISTSSRKEDVSGDAGYVKHLLATQKITGYTVLPYILNEDVSLLHLGLCAYDDALVTMFNASRSNLQRQSLQGSQKATKGLLPPIKPNLQPVDGEDEHLLQPYTLSLLPPLTSNSLDSTMRSTPKAYGKTPPVAPSVEVSTNNRREAAAATVSPRKRTPSPTKTKVKVPLDQRDVVNNLMKRQFVVYPLCLPPQVGAPPEAGVNAAPLTLPEKVKGKGKQLATASAMSDVAFARKEIPQRMFNAEQTVVEASAVHHSSMMVSMTVMQLAISSSKSMSQSSRTSPQYYTIPCDQLDPYFESSPLPEDVSSSGKESRHFALRKNTEANGEMDRIISNLLLYAGRAAEAPNLQVVSVPVFQPEGYELNAAKPISIADALDEWIKQHEMRVHFKSDASHSRRSSLKKRGRESVASQRTAPTSAAEHRKRLSLSTSRRGVSEPSDVSWKQEESAVDAEASPIHSAAPTGGVASPEQQSLMRVLLRQFSLTAGGKLSQDMGLQVNPNYNVDKCGDAVLALQTMKAKQDSKLPA